MRNKKKVAILAGGGDTQPLNADTFSATEEWFDYIDPIVDFKSRDVSHY